MSYHVEASRSGFKELPDRILVREDGAYGASKEHGTPIIDHWYVPEQRMTDTEREALTRRIDELCQENERLRELADGAMNEADRLTHDAAALQIENAKLRELMYERAHVYAIQNMTEDELRITATNVMEDNAKLRELITDVHEALCADKAGIFHRLTLASMEDDMRKLGIEVD